ncbi:MAG: HesA/MoeB/ThiF family protein, partial [Candidatus Omnitrophica bacterium]|nr:HesA/MoeB/ThiF family protein [Candidatus Omnitrophota bacterium]
LIYLAAAGVGTIGIIDADEVDVSNLQRQIIHGQSDVGRPKVVSAEASVREVNPFVQVKTVQGLFTPENAAMLIKDYDLVIDAVDNLGARYAINDACVAAGKPWVHGSILRFEGQASVFWPGRGPCYRCLFPEPPPPEFVPTGAEAGILGILPGVIGPIEATEALKVLLGIGEPLIGRLLVFDALRMD